MSELSTDTTRQPLSERAISFVRRQSPRLALGIVLAAPISSFQAAEHSVETASFKDHFGAVPVELGLQHNGTSTLEGGIFGQVHLYETGIFGFGLNARPNGPPEGGGTLASYIDPEFVQRNAEAVGNVDSVATSYAAEAKDEVIDNALQRELVYSAVLGIIIWGGVTSRYKGKEHTKPVHWRLSAAALVGATAVSAGGAAWQFDRWSDKQVITESYRTSQWPNVSFSSRETLELARQVVPAWEKNKERTKAEADQFIIEATSSFDVEILGHITELQPRAGERIVLAEADTQGGVIGTSVRTYAYSRIIEEIGSDAFIARVIAGDFTSNGTVGEAGYTKIEIAASGEIPTIVSLGDHDTGYTEQQLDDGGALTPDLETVEVHGIGITGATDPERKSLFGGLVENETGVTETELGETMRTVIETDSSDIAAIHQPEAAAGLLGVSSISEVLDDTRDVVTLDIDPPASLKILLVGHTHTAMKPKVIMRSDGTTMVLDQLGSANGVENRPLLSRFSTPDSAPLKEMMVRLHYIDEITLQPTGYITLSWSTDGQSTISERTDLVTDAFANTSTADAEKPRKSE